MSHVDFTDIVNNIAGSNWGKKFDSPDAAAKEMIGDIPRLTAFAMIELLKRFNAVANAVGKSDCSHRRKLQIPGNVKRYPDKSVGDRLFRGDIMDGISEYIIVAKGPDGVCLVIAMNDFDLEYPTEVFVACDDTHGTLEGALRSDIGDVYGMSYYTRIADYYKTALDAVDSGEDLSRFTDAMPEDE